MEGLPFTLETEMERRIASDPAWKRGVEWGQPRKGHQEGQVKYHIVEVLANIDRQEIGAEERASLRLVALVHDTFKYQVNPDKPRVGTNHHGYLARVFAERYIADPVLLDLIELHDEAYNSWLQGKRKGRWQDAEERAKRLLERIGTWVDLYRHFYYADNHTDSKEQEPFSWFEQYLERKRINCR